jgi:hypothetical protein
MVKRPIIFAAVAAALLMWPVGRGGGSGDALGERGVMSLLVPRMSVVHAAPPTDEMELARQIAQLREQMERWHVELAAAQQRLDELKASGTQSPDRRDIQLQINDLRRDIALQQARIDAMRQRLFSRLRANDRLYEPSPPAADVPPPAPPGSATSTINVTGSSVDPVLPLPPLPPVPAAYSARYGSPTASHDYTVGSYIGPTFGYINGFSGYRFHPGAVSAYGYRYYYPDTGYYTPWYYPPLAPIGPGCYVPRLPHHPYHPVPYAPAGGVYFRYHGDNLHLRGRVNW